MVVAGTCLAPHFNIQAETIEEPYAFNAIAGTAETRGSTDGPLNVGRFHTPGAVVADAAGNLYVADTNNHTIRKVTSTGVTSTLAGTAGAIGSADGVGAVARFAFPSGIAVDASGTIFVADTINHTIRKITPSGQVSTVAGTSGAGGHLDANGRAARFFHPEGIVVDDAGSLYVADRDNHVIRKITPAGAVTTFAGRPATTGSANGAANIARFLRPHGLAKGGSGNLYVSDENHLVRKVSATGFVTRLAGAAGLAGAEDGAGADARFNQPRHLATDGARNIYLADESSHTIRKITPSGVVTTLGGVQRDPGSVDSVGTEAKFNFPRGVAIDGDGTLYVADSNNHTIRRGLKILGRGQLEYGFTTIADNIFSSSFAGSFQDPSINSLGAVGFSARNKSGATGVYTAEEGTVTPLLTSTTPGFTGATFLTPVLNDAGTVAFLAFLGDGEIRVYTAQNGALSTAAIANPSAVFRSLHGPSLSASGTVAFAATTQNGAGIFTRNGAVTTTVAETGSAFASFIGEPAIAGNTVAFAATTPTGATQVVSTTNGVRTVVASTAGGVFSGLLEGPTLSSSGGVGFLASLTSGGSGIFTSSGGTTLKIADTRGAFASFFAGPALNAAGQVAFAAKTSTLSGLGIFIGPDSVADRVVAPGDTLFGSTVEEASVGPRSLNNSGEIAFRYRLSDAREGVAVAVMLPPRIISPAAATAAPERQYIYQIVATNRPTTYSASGLPAGLTLDSSTGIISGEVAAAGTYEFRVSATNSAGTAETAVTLTVVAPPPFAPILASTTAAAVRTASPFQFQVLTVGSSSGARVSATGLPPGLMINPVTGLISGTPAVDGSFGVTLAVTEAGITTTSTLQLTFSSDPLFPSIVSPDKATLVPGQPFTYRIITSSRDDSDPVRFRVIGALPPGLTFNPATGTISGTPTVSGRGKPFSGGIPNVHISGTNLRGTSGIQVLFPPAPTGVANIATRLAVGTDQNVLIGGFIITGDAPKKVIIRAIAPSLQAGGVALPGTLRDPVLRLFGGSTPLAENDDWREAQEDEIIASTVEPQNERESAIVAILDPGAYTAMVSGKEQGTGIGLVEVYDLGTATTATASKAQLANISTRGFVKGGDDVMIGGFIVWDGGSKVIVRAIGPSLAEQGLAGVLADPTLDLFDANGSLVRANDNWRTGDQEEAIVASQVEPKNERESAIVATLPRGGYTAVLRGKNNSTGVALVEAYVLQ